MLQRFVSGAAIAAVAIACAAFAVLIIPGITWQRAYPLALLWCFAPLGWGIWAMLAPRGFVPHRLPIWGAILGLIAGTLAAFVLNIPSRVLGQSAPATLRGVGVIAIVVVYYALWTLVRAVYQALATTQSVAPKTYTTAA